MNQDMTGWYYELPPGLEWQQVADSRKKWGIDPMHVPLAVAPGVVAWGRLLPSNYKRAA